MANETRSSDLKLYHLTCEYLADPLGIDVGRPRLAWKVESSRRGAKQRAFRILVASSGELLKQGQGDLWDSGRVESGRSTHIEYAGKPLSSGRRVWWAVRAWDDHDRPTDWTAAATWEMGLLELEDWKGQWIAQRDDGQPWRGANWIWTSEAGDPLTKMPASTRQFRRRFMLAERPAEAWAYITADDQYELRINGQVVDATERPEPGFGEGHRAVRLVEVTEQMRAGENELLVTAANEEGPAGVLFYLWARDGAGVVTAIASNARAEWSADGMAPWRKAREVGPYGCAPWGDFAVAIGRSPLLRKAFTVAKAVKSARLYATALGSYRLHLNGQRVGNEAWTPEWTDYRQRVLYQTYDVTSLLQQGTNALGALLGDGWYASGMMGNLNRFDFGPPPVRLRAQLRVDYTDGTSDTIATDGTWRAMAGPILRSELYAGETCDRRKLPPGWDTANFDDGAWPVALVVETEARQLDAQMSPPVRITRELAPRTLSNPSPGVWVFDMGQNMVGWARLRVGGSAGKVPRGTMVRLRFAELLKPDGNVYRANLRGANATDTWWLRGDDVEMLEPHFTYHGFRYVELTGFPGTPALEDLVGCVAHTDAAWVGQFECSEPAVNQLWRNISWGQRGNIFSVPTDCPQRDERFGWMGDATVFAPTSCYNMDLAAFYTKWMQDIVDGQSAAGGFGDVSPRASVCRPRDGAPAWADAGIFVPWTVYRMYGDTRLLEKHYGAMEKYMRYLAEANPDFIRTNRRNNDFGDWVPADSETPKDLLATAFWAADATIMSVVARALGKADDAARYDKLHQAIRAAFIAHYVKEDGVVGNGSQTCQVLALQFQLLPDGLADAAGRHLVGDIEKRGGHLSTGFIGTAFLMPVLSEAGHSDVAYRLLLQREYPSWLYMVDCGATTIWERWNSWNKETGPHEPGMNSYNHYAFGSVGEWLYRYVGGIDMHTGKPNHIMIRPCPGPGIDWAKTSYDSIYGPVGTEWRKQGDELVVEVMIPANCSAGVVLPAKDRSAVREGADAPGVRFLTFAEGKIAYHVEGGGSVRFVTAMR
ncbi:MAG TPA: family 78 glycoside hydrolase catalytic domain [Tepidisphaeraceae bacterium]|jgi:alpha-L-rhamnosidase